MPPFKSKKATRTAPSETATLERDAPVIPAPEPADLDLMQDEDYRAGFDNLQTLNRRQIELEQRITVAARPQPNHFDHQLGELVVGDDEGQPADEPEPGAGEDLDELRADLNRVKAAIARQEQINARLRGAAITAVTQRLRPHYSGLALRIAATTTALLQLLHDEARIRKQVSQTAPDVFGGRLQPMIVPDLQQGLGKLLDRARAGGYIDLDREPAPSSTDPARAVVVATTGMASPHGSTQPGDVVELPLAEAKRLIAAGFAMPMLPPRPPEPDADAEQEAA